MIDRTNEELDRLEDQIKAALIKDEIASYSTQGVTLTIVPIDADKKLKIRKAPKANK